MTEPVPAGRRSRITGLAAAAVLALGGPAMTTAAAPAVAVGATSQPSASTPNDWHKYVLGPSSPQVYPKALTESRGDVSRPAALVERNGTTTLTTVAGQTPASVLVDFGQEMSGPLFMDVVRTAGSGGGALPTLQVATGEALSFIRRPLATTVTADTPAGATSIPVASVNGVEVNSEIVLGTGASAQTRTVASFAPTAGTGNGAGTITVTAPLSDPVFRSVPAQTGPPPVPAVPATAVTSTTAGPASDENPGQALVGGNDLLTPTGPGRLDTGSHPGFRFALLTLTTPGTMTIRDLGVDFQAFRATPEDYRGWFESSDEELNRLWYAGAYTLQMNLKLPGLRGLPDGRVYDGAKRDGSIWTGDLIIQTPTAVATLGDVGEQYVKSSLEELLREQRADGHLPGSPDFNKGRTSNTGPNAPYAVGQGSPLYYSVNYSGYGARSIIDYYRYSGDDDFARQSLAQVERAVAYNQAFLDTDKSLIAPRNPANPSDPTYTRGDRDYFQSYLPGYVTKYSIDYYVLLREMAWFERQVGTAEKAASYDATADAIKKAVTATLWNQQGGFFGQSDLNMDRIAGDVNGLALQYGFVPKGQESRVLEAIKVNWNPYGAIMGEGLVDPTGHTIEPFGIGMETGGRLAVDDTAGAFDLMRRTWGTMIDPANPLYTGAFWEFKNSTGGVNRTTASLAHGWAAAPTVQLTENVLGIAPTGPGYSTWTLKPHPGDLGWSKGAVPAEDGEIGVSWTSDKKAGTFALSAASPISTRGTVSVPVTSTSTVTLNGVRVWSNGVAAVAGVSFADGYVSFPAAGGALDVRVAPTGTTTGPAPAPQKSATTTRAKIAQKRITTSTRARLKVTVRGAGGGEVDGRVKVRLDGRLVAKARLNETGKVTRTLDRLGAGKHKVVVVYPGSATTEESRDVLRFTVRER